MKTVVALAVVFSFFTLTTSAADINEDRCRQLKSYSTLSHAKQVEDDLSTGIWTFENANTEFTIQFDANGIAHQISETRTGQLAHSTMLWNVQTFGDATVLTLTEPNLNSQRYLVKQNCEGVLLRSTRENVTAQWQFEKPEQHFALETLQMQLSGNWKTISYTEDGRTQRYHFDQNGEFQLTENANTKTGVWDLSANGSFITLYFQNAEGQFTEKQVLKIVDIDYHVASFVIDQEGEEMKIQYLEKV